LDKTSVHCTTANSNKEFPQTFPNIISELPNAPDQVQVSLTVSHCLKVLEFVVKFLNERNDELQQHIRSNKDKQNQKIVDALLKRYSELRDKDFQGDEIADELNNIVCNATGQNIDNRNN